MGKVLLQFLKFREKIRGVWLILVGHMGHLLPGGVSFVGHQPSLQT